LLERGDLTGALTVTISLESQLTPDELGALAEEAEALGVQDAQGEGRVSEPPVIALTPDANPFAVEYKDVTDTALAARPDLPPDTGKVAAHIRLHIEEVLRLLLPLHAARDTLGSLAANLDASICTRVSQLFDWLVHTCSVGAAAASVSVYTPTASCLSELPAGPHSGLFCLCLAHVCTALQAQELPKLTKLLPCAAKSSGSRKADPSAIAIDLPAVLDQFREIASVQLGRYVEVSVRSLTTLVRSPAAVPTEAKQALAVSPSLVRVLSVLDVVDWELGLFFTTGRTHEKRDRLVAMQAAATKAEPGPGSQRSNATRDTQQADKLTRHFERLFAQKITTFGPVKFTRASPFVAVLKALFKALVEVTRSRPPLELDELHRLELDTHVLRALVVKSVYISADDAKTLAVVLDEVVASGIDRCKVAVGPAGTATDKAGWNRLEADAFLAASPARPLLAALTSWGATSS
jgi:hypothetical protein